MSGGRGGVRVDYGSVPRSVCLQWWCNVYRMTDELRQEAACTMVFAGDITICSDSTGRVEVKPESWI